MAIPDKNRDLSSASASDLQGPLVEGLRRRDERAYREVVERWADRLYHIAYRFVRRKEEAQEIVQEVFQKIVEKIDTFKGESKLDTWIYRIAVNESLMRIRSNKQHRSVSWEEVLPRYEDGIFLEKASDWSALPDSKLEERETRELVRAGIEELPEDYRAAYLLKDVEQLSEEEAGQALGISKTTLKMRVHRARLFLRKKLEKRFFKK